MRRIHLRIAVLSVLLTSLFAGNSLLAQSTIATGSIGGTVTDPSGAIVPSAKVTITNTETGQKTESSTSSAGAFNSGALAPGRYVVRIEAPGFKSEEASVMVQVGNTSSIHSKLSVGAQSETVEVTAAAITVNTEQSSVQGVLTAQQIENLPMNGRNFLDLAQLEPGVQIQDGGNFDPTKNGFSSISFGGKAGRTARITVDGIDISDENVGTTTQNVSAGSISEFQLSQSSLDLSTELTSSGSVNVVTKSGTNAYHGEAFGLFRDRRLGANFPGGQSTYYQRNQFGGGFGGAFIKDKLFFFLNAERTKQDQVIPLTPPAPFQNLPSGYPSLYRDTETISRLDWNAPKGVKVFYKFNYNWDKDVLAYGQTYQPFANKNNTPSHGVGIDFSTGKWTHTIRYGFLNFNNQIADAVKGNPGVFDPVAQWGIALRNGPAGVETRYGPSRLAPQVTIQHNNQLKYDGSHLMGSHLFRFGGDYNRIGAGGLASFYGLAPELRTQITSAAQAAADLGPLAGGRGNPLNYLVTGAILGNGQGFGSEKPAFGYKGGGFTDNRLNFYVGDNWKIRSNLSVNYGVRYVRDTGRGPTDLAAPTCDQVNAANFSTVPCTGSGPLLQQFAPLNPGVGGRVQQPNHNFGPQLGVAWDPTGSGKTVIRAGAGVYYENNVLNNILFDRAYRLQQGLFNNTPVICPSGTLVLPGGGAVTSFPYNGVDTPITGNICGARAVDAAPVIAALQNYYQQQTTAAGPQGNSSFIGNTLSFTNVVGAKYKTPYSYQMNVGFQREIHSGVVLTADFLRNVSLRYLINVDTNHVGDARYLNVNAARNAMATTTQAFGCAGGSSSAAIDCAIAAGATMEDFAGNNLGSAGSASLGDGVFGGQPASAFGLTPDTGAAFPGINPNVGGGFFLLPIGRSVYNGMQLKLAGTTRSPVRGIAESSFQISYALSRLKSQIDTDQDFSANAADNRNPARYFGASSLDRTHQLSFAGNFTIAHGPQLSGVAHLFSPLAVTPLYPNLGRTGEIFYTDVTGDGTVGDIVPGANIGSYGRDFNGSNINKLINAANAANAGKLTPAGQALVTAGLFTSAQLTSLGAVIDTLPTAPADQLPLTWLRTVDVRLDWPIHIGERFVIHPSVAGYNLFNFSNFNPSTVAILSGVLDGSGGSINGTSKADKASVNSVRTGVGSGVNTIGSPRQVEFGLRITF